MKERNDWIIGGAKGDRTPDLMTGPSALVSYWVPRRHRPEVVASEAVVSFGIELSESQKIKKNPPIAPEALKPKPNNLSLVPDTSAKLPPNLKKIIEARLNSKFSHGVRFIRRSRSA